MRTEAATAGCVLVCNAVDGAAVCYFYRTIKRHPHNRIRGDLRFLSAVCMRFCCCPHYQGSCGDITKQAQSVTCYKGVAEQSVKRFKIALELGLFLGHV